MKLADDVQLTSRCSWIWPIKQIAIVDHWFCDDVRGLELNVETHKFTGSQLSIAAQIKLNIGSASRHNDGASKLVITHHPGA